MERLRADLECAKDYVSDVADGFGWKLCDPAIIATACSDHNRIVETLEATIPLAALASPQPGNEEVIERYVKTLRGYADGMERFGMLSHGYDAFSVSPVELREIADLLTKPAHQADGERS